MQTLPTSDEIFEINLQMEGMANAIDSAGNVLTIAGQKMDRFAKSWFWRLIDGWKADMFGATFMNMALAINRGILWPVKNLLPQSSEIEEVVKQLDMMVEVLNKVGEVLDAMSQAMLDIANADIDFTALDSIPLEQMATFAGALRDMSIASAGGNAAGSNAAGGIASGGEDPSAKAIETQIAKQQADAQSSMAMSMSELLNEAIRGEGLVVRDLMALRMQRSMAQMQQEAARASIMPTAAQAAAQRQAVSSIDLLRPAIQAVNPAPAAGSVDMRRASQSMRDTPEQRATADERRERRQRNRWTNRRAEREEARRRRREGAGFETGGQITPTGVGTTPRGTTPRIGEAHGTGALTERAIAQGIEHQAREAEGDQPIGYRLANAASAEQIASQGIMPPIQMPQMNTSERDVLAALVRLVNNPSAQVMPQTPISVENTAKTLTAGDAEMKPVVQPTLNVPDINTLVSGDRAATQPTTTEVVAPELGEIASETSNQTDLLGQLKELFEKVVDILKPRTPPNSGTSGQAPDTKMKMVTHPPPNYRRPTTGLVAQSAPKAVLNLGPPNA
jgi:hypothetical protein